MKAWLSDDKAISCSCPALPCSLEVHQTPVQMLVAGLARPSTAHQHTYWAEQSFVCGHQVTSHQLHLQREADKREQDEKAQQAQRAAKREARPFCRTDLLLSSTPIFSRAASWQAGKWTQASNRSGAGDAQVSEDDYDSIVAAPNINRQADDEPSARTVEGAISLLSVDDAATPEDRHPERRVQCRSCIVPGPVDCRLLGPSFEACTWTA